MTELKEVYKCEVCGNIVEMLHPGGGTLVCCGQDMTFQNVNTFDEVGEKHMPELFVEDDIAKVVVGSIEHPMTEEHYIEWIEIHLSDKVLRKHLQPGDEPKAEFCLDHKAVVMVRAYCNLHGMWQKNI